MAHINITCDQCHTTHEVYRTNEIPYTVTSMGCNWCPNCEANDYYHEWYNHGDDGPTKPDPDDPKQLCMPFPIIEILEGELITQN